MEVNFVDIGQGDGCHVVTPDDKHIIVDAGKSDNMVRYLSWRFNLHNKTVPLDFPIDVVISHSDTDHYLGFSYIFQETKLKIGTIYHNGLVERPGKNSLGEVSGDYITGLVNNTTDMMAILSDASNRNGSGSQYCSTLYKVVNPITNTEFKALSRDDGFMAGNGPRNKVNDKEFSVEVLAPIREDVGGKPGLKSIKNLGKDKNGHSVILKLKYGHAKILLGGDVNEEFGKIIHSYYEGKKELSKLKVDVAKACHHGSNHFDYNFVIFEGTHRIVSH
jgi:hypothetical protein